MYVFWVYDLGFLAEVDAYAAIEDDFIVKGFTNECGAFNVEEGDYDTSERFERCPCVDWHMLIY